MAYWELLATFYTECRREVHVSAWTSTFIPFNIAVTISLDSLITPSHVSVLTLKVHVTPALGWGCGFKQVTVVERVLEGQLPQFVAMILYFIAGQVDMTGFQVNVSSLEVTLANSALVGC